jgi:ABC-2 type transport system permease protein
MPVLAAEWRKAISALAPRLITAALLIGIVGLSAGMVLADDGTDTALALKVEAFTREGGWEGLHVLAGVILANGGLLACGMMLTWLFGREFVDRTVPGLFGLPTPLRAVAAAKLALYGLWTAGMSLAIPALLGCAGLVLGFGPPDAGTLAGFGKIGLVSALTALLALPAAWVATRTRGYLAPVGAITGIIIAAQISVFTGAGAWFPFAAPGIWASQAGEGSGLEVSAVQLSLVVPTGLAFAALCLRAWDRLHL